MTSLMAIVPDNKPGPFPVMYLPHGVSDDHKWDKTYPRYAEVFGNVLGFETCFGQ